MNPTNTTPAGDSDTPTTRASAAGRTVNRPDGRLARVADLAWRHRRITVLAWLIALVAIAAGGGARAGTFDADYTAAGSDSRAARELLDARLPTAAAETITLVAHADTDLTTAPARAQVERLRQRLRDQPHVDAVGSPFDTPGALSADRRTAIIQIRLDVDRPSAMPTGATQAIMDTTADASTDTVTFSLNGQVIADVQNGSGGPEIIGLAAAALILLLTFGSVIAAGLPVGVAVAGLAISSSLIGLLAHVLSVPPWAPALAAMLGIGVGVDYVLLMVTRYRENLAGGLQPRPAIRATVDTAGRSVMIAGATVIVSLVGLIATGLSYLQGAAVAAMLAVAVVMLAAITLLPALLGFTGDRIDRLSLPWSRCSRAASTGWQSWARFVQRRAVPATILGSLLLIILILPVHSVRFGLPDAGNDPAGSTSRAAYDHISDSFGVGVNGPLILAADLTTPGAAQGLPQLTQVFAAVPGVAAVSPAQIGPAGDVAAITVIPAGSPQSTRTQKLVEDLRSRVIPAATAGTGTRVYVGGPTAAAIDFNADIANRLPLLVGGVVLLAVLLLLLTFRSIAIAAKAAALNLLSIGAAYGVIALVLKGGWAGHAVGIDTPTPLPAYIPVLVFAILFGLSMDYEVFLLTRMHEHRADGADDDTAVVAGMAGTGRVITAAAAIMVAVFASFVPSVNLTLKLLGVGLGTAILIDATVVRMLLVPAVLRLHGRWAWWLPTHLQRLLPTGRTDGSAAGVGQ